MIVGMFSNVSLSLIVQRRQRNFVQIVIVIILEIGNQMVFAHNVVENWKIKAFVA